MKGFNVLIIEDDTIILHSLKRLLESKGLNIFINQTGENVIQQLVDMHLIIMDIMLLMIMGFQLRKTFGSSLISLLSSCLPEMILTQNCKV